MRTKLAKMLWALHVKLKELSQLACDHKAVQIAINNGYKTNYCWTCGKTGKGLRR